MHRTLKAETTNPPSGNLQAQQTRFQSLSHRIQRRTPARSAWTGNAGVCLSPVSPRAAADAHAARISSSLRSPSRQSQQWHSLEETLGLRHAHARRRVRRPRGSRRRVLGCILRPAETRPDGRTPAADRRSQRPNRSAALAASRLTRPGRRGKATERAQNAPSVASPRRGETAH